MKKRSVNILGHATSVSLEEPFWDELQKIAAKKDVSVNALISQIEEMKISLNLSSAIRIFILQELKKMSS